MKILIAIIVLISLQLQFSDKDLNKTEKNSHVSCLNTSLSDSDPYDPYEDGPCELSYGSICYDENNEKNPFLYNAKYVGSEDEESNCSGTEICEN